MPQYWPGAGRGWAGPGDPPLHLGPSPGTPAQRPPPRDAQDLSPSRTWGSDCRFATPMQDALPRSPRKVWGVLPKTGLCVNRVPGPGPPSKSNCGGPGSLGSPALLRRAPLRCSPRTPKPRLRPTMPAQAAFPPLLAHVCVEGEGARELGGASGGGRGCSTSRLGLPHHANPPPPRCFRRIDLGIIESPAAGRSREAGAPGSGGHCGAAHALARRHLPLPPPVASHPWPRSQATPLSSDAMT